MNENTDRQIYDLAKTLQLDGNHAWCPKQLLWTLYLSFMPFANGSKPTRHQRQEGSKQLRAALEAEAFTRANLIVSKKLLNLPGTDIRAIIMHNNSQGDMHKELASFLGTKKTKRGLKKWDGSIAKCSPLYLEHPVGLLPYVYDVLVSRFAGGFVPFNWFCKFITDNCCPMILHRDELKNPSKITGKKQVRSRKSVAETLTMFDEHGIEVEVLKRDQF